MSDDEPVHENSFIRHFELYCGIILAVFAAALAINDLGAGKFGDDELIAYGQAQRSYDWYNSKGIKQNLAEGQQELLESLVAAGTIPIEQQAGIQKNLESLNEAIGRYKKEKKEILLGSKDVGEANWAQDVDGKFGQITGAKEYESLTESLGKAGDLFDMGTLFLQLCLVIGAISLILKEPIQKTIFFGACVLGGSIGIVYTVLASAQAAL